VGTDQRRTGSTQAPSSSPADDHTETSATTGLAAEAQTDFSAITDGGDSDESEDLDAGVIGRIRALL